MAATKGYVCDGCGEPRKPSNHWIVALVQGTGVAFYVWDDEMLRDGDVAYKHLCGAGCASKLLSTTIECWR